MIAKRSVHDLQKPLRKRLVGARQCGVALPGGADVLVHARRCLEAAAESSSSAVAVLDLDLRNAFPSFEWSAVREAVHREFPALDAWTAWTHQAPARICLPTGTWIECDRGAEQGDPLGPVYCCLVLLHVAEATAASVLDSGSWCTDLWFMDDGQVALEPLHAKAYLAAFDSRLSAAGGTRVCDGEFKSTARLCGSSSAIAAVPASWSEGVQETCRILTSPPPKVLGVGIDGDDVASQFSSVMRKTTEVGNALRSINDAAVELALLRLSTGVCRVQHLLRAAGPEVQLEQLLDFDEAVEDTLSTTLGGGVAGEALDRAFCGASQGGLGLRRAVETRWPAFLASRTDSRPLAVEVLTGLPDALRDGLFSHWDEQVSNATSAWLAELPSTSVPLARQVIAEGARSAADRTARLLGHLPDAATGVAPPTHDRVHAALVTPVGLADAEHPERRASAGLQALLSDIAARGRVDALAARLQAASDWCSVRQLSDLRDPGTDHSWIWLSASASGFALLPLEFCTAIRMRIGASMIAQASPCACCNGVVDSRCHHALRCAPGESTRGHNWVAGSLLGLASLADSTSLAEPRGLIPSRPGLRPADLLTFATIGRGAALDVSIVSPDSSGAGTDACVATTNKKMDKYKHVLHELHEEGLEYTPVVWSCWGRPGSAASSTVRQLACSAARRRGIADPSILERHVNAIIGCFIWKRVASMALACLGRRTREDVASLLQPSEDLDSSDCDDEDQGAGTAAGGPAAAVASGAVRQTSS